MLRNALLALVLSTTTTVASDLEVSTVPPPVIYGPVVQRRMFVVPVDVPQGFMYMRTGPGINYELLGTIPGGEIVPAVGPCVQRLDGRVGPDFCLVAYGNIAGWVSRSGLMQVQEER
jgi:hypothetical protein